jgi:hypothetical protein
MSERDVSERYCIVGAGPSGLAAAKNLKALGVAFDVYEAHSDVGGLWDIANPSSALYDSTHTITSKTVTPYTDFPVPDDYPTYMHHKLVLRYLRAYARHFGLLGNIYFGKRIQKAKKADAGGWLVQVEGEPGALRYKGLIIASGHHWCPKLPSYPGNFSGTAFHSKEYKRPDGLAGKRVLVVGSGNTGCDIAVEVSKVAARTYLSTRRSYYYVPKFLFGIPVDVLGQSSQSISLPIWLVRFFYRLMVWLAMGDQTKYGLPKPDHKLLQTPPIANSFLPYHVAHGDIELRPDIERFSGDQVHFGNGLCETIDCIVYATGFQPKFPFIDDRHLALKNGRPNPYLFIFHPEYDDLFFAGLTDGTGGHFPTVDHATQLIAHFVWALDHDVEGARVFARKKAGPPPDLSRGIAFIDTPRNYTQFELNYYTKQLKDLTKWFAKRRDRMRRSLPDSPLTTGTEVPSESTL